MTRFKQDENSDYAINLSVESGKTATGRRLGLTVYYLLLVYVIGAGAISIIPQIFFPSPTLSPQKAAAEIHCAQEIRSLKSELLEKTNDFVNDDRIDRQRQWFVRWDKRFHMLGKGCGKLEPTRIELKKLRDDMESMMQRFYRKKTPLINKIDRALMGIPDNP